MSFTTVVCNLVIPYLQHRTTLTTTVWTQQRQQKSIVERVLPKPPTQPTRSGHSVCSVQHVFMLLLLLICFCLVFAFFFSRVEIEPERHCYAFTREIAKVSSCICHRKGTKNCRCTGAREGLDSPASSLPRPLDKKTNDAFIQRQSHSEVKYTQIPTGKCWIFQIKQYTELAIVHLLASRFISSRW